MLSDGGISGLELWGWIGYFIVYMNEIFIKKYELSF